MFDTLGRLLYQLMMQFNDLVNNNPVLTATVFTIIIRLIMSPFDIISRKAMQKQMAAQPYLLRIQKRYESNPQVMQKKISEFNRKHGVSLWKGCLPMLLTWPIFIIFFDAMRYWANVETVKMFLDASNGVYDISHNAFLWVHNIWQPDSGLASVIVPGANFAALPFDNLARFFSAESMELVREAAANGGAVYTQVMAPVAQQYEGVMNGWFILPLLSAGLVVLQSFITQSKQMRQAQAGQRGGMSPWVMNIVIALITGYICLSYNALFTVYWVVSNLCSIILQLILRAIYPMNSYKFEGEAEL